jgi:hypothetical protein
MSVHRTLSLHLIELFTLLDHSIQKVPDEHKGSILARFCIMLKGEYKVAQADIDEGMRMLVFKDDCRKGFVSPDGVVRRKETIATRTVPMSKGEEIGENGLWWRDVNRQ